jgi:Xaa-Pro dipeptidase
MTQTPTSLGLTKQGCRQRQTRLALELRTAGLDAALLFHRRHVHAFSGFWSRGVFQSVLLITAERQTNLAAPFEPSTPVFADQTLVFPGALLGTLVDDQWAAAVQSLSPRLGEFHRIGTDGPSYTPSAENISDILRRVRRCKLPDEIGLIRRGIAGCEAAYARARHIISPGLTEWDLYLEVLSAATGAVGEPIGELGNDFQSGTPGGPPRKRPMESGELIPLDLSVYVRGYASDLCRTFAVNSRPTSAQHDAQKRVASALDHIEKTVRPGVSCRQLYHDVAATLNGYRGWRFPHHLGHGIGLSPHESPRLNPNWNDVFQVGDVFTAEPGLYSPELGGGVRLEKNYLVTGDGITALCSFPLDL